MSCDSYLRKDIHLWNTNPEINGVATFACNFVGASTVNLYPAKIVRMNTTKNENIIVTRDFVYGNNREERHHKRDVLGSNVKITNRATNYNF